MSRQTREYKNRSFAVACAIATLALSGQASADAGRGDDRGEHRRTPERQPLDCARDPRVLLGLVSLDVCRGADLFFRETFGGNGRTCGTCHPAANNYTVDPDYIAGLSRFDPMFVAERVPALQSLENSRFLRELGLFVVNADGFEDPAHKYVLRSTPHMLSMSVSIKALPNEENGVAADFTTSPPNVRAGWSGDGAPGQGNLSDFALGAIQQHSTRSLERVPGRDFVVPSAAQAEQIAQFTLGLGRTKEIDLEAVLLSDAGAERGRNSFLTGPARDCNVCHNSAGANTPFFDTDLNDIVFFNVNFSVGSELLRGKALDEAGIPHDGGFGTKPRDADRDGVIDRFGNTSFNTPPLIEAADTGPFFHTNAFRTIEDAIRFYTTPEFGSSPSGLVEVHGSTAGAFNLDDAAISDLGRFLRVLNASLNAQMASSRLRAASQIAASFGPRHLDVQRGLLTMANEEIDDALRVLSDVKRLNLEAQALLRRARKLISDGCDRSSPQQRRTNLERALADVEQADRLLGSGMDYRVGPATLMF